MIKLYAYRVALLALAAGLFTCASAQAQSRSAATSFTTTGGPGAAPAKDKVAAEKAGELPNLSLPPTPEENSSFYDDSHKSLQQALAWMVQTNGTAPTYWNLYTESRIRLKMKDYSGACTAAEQAYQLALKAMPASHEYVLLSAAVLAETQPQGKH